MPAPFRAEQQDAADGGDFTLVIRGEELQGAEIFARQAANRREALGSNSEVQGFRVDSTA
jgi:hypothetical protein